MRDKEKMEETKLKTHCARLALMLSAACRHWAQSVLRRRGWVPESFLPASTDGQTDNCMFLASFCFAFKAGTYVI